MFMDIRMPGQSGLELLAGLPPGVVPAVIFLTAYDQYAAEAFEREALDYVLKPIDEDRFDASLARARREKL
jgi:two-component system LytT family response regulator